ncbi:MULTISPECIES: RelA/SpoT domain-containing protein [Enterobacter cloacae complex]|jgi:ppGpp synthetase/RelA/SpoT-type nucleotidyltranferase|uniref:RelA/SpoT domain-containing protein n=1 Tax=Enterobacter cloacae complex TaxID=354276 RepID=UPI000A93A95D|nr:RelA/SpoT domain-containing protein [Enterobacter cloacae]MDE7636059.1 RelA/SpoT domain-containing protein [Enterobacter cloacae]HED1598734.1 RelA/SpoT domain-containing protein [Enterobacter cloacae subsp. cloacae]HED2541895.1 RelA/SpoT domain-containing protein [Enterobacter cloacae subsp. cloacae]
MIKEKHADIKMAELRYTKGEINKAGDILRIKPTDRQGYRELFWALNVLNNLREMYVHPLNAFQTTLRRKMKVADAGAIASQRLKRIPSIIGKLKRSPKMQLARMQDLGGLRAVVSDIDAVRSLEKSYLKNSYNRFKHVLTSHKDYIDQPKASGYRGIHLVYKYQGATNPHHNGLLLEIQIRTKMQHAWATAVETMGTFIGQSIKSSEADVAWNEYFAVVASAFALMEGCNPVPQYAHLTKLETFKLVEELTIKLAVIDKLLAFRVAVADITNNGGSYHLLVLDTASQNVQIKSFGIRRINEATTEYLEWEKKAEKNPYMQVVLVSTQNVSNLKAAYPSYFLDAEEFVRIINIIRAECL